eukprot:13504621-Alexandrium_andersonii.AAC.1
MRLLQGHHRTLVEELEDAGPLGASPMVPGVHQPPDVPRGDANLGAPPRGAMAAGQDHIPQGHVEGQGRPCEGGWRLLRATHLPQDPR